MTYAEKLKDPRWQRKRLEILQRDDFTCRVCNSETKTLHVHHIRYFKGREPWEYKEFYLVTLCEDCHKLEENEIKGLPKVSKPKPRTTGGLAAFGLMNEPNTLPWEGFKLSRSYEEDHGTPEELEAFFSGLRGVLDEKCDGGRISKP